MAKSSVYEGRSYDEAVKKGLDDLGLTRAEATITLIEEGKGGFLGLGSRPFRVSIMRRPGGAVREPEERGERRVQGSRKDDRRGGRGGRDRDRGREAPGQGGREREGQGGRERDRDRDRDRKRGQPQPVAARAESGRVEAGRPERPERRERRGDRPREERPPRPRDERAPRPQPVELRSPEPEEEDERGPIEAGPVESVDTDNGPDDQRRRRRRGRRGGRGRRRGGAGSDVTRGGAEGPVRGAVALAEPESDYEVSIETSGAPSSFAAPPAPADLPAAPVLEPVARMQEEPAPPVRLHEPTEGGEAPPRGASHARGHEGSESSMSAEELAETSRRLTENLLKSMGFEAKVSVTAEGDRADVTVEVAEDDDLLTGQKGEVRQAMQHLLNRFLNRGEGSRYHLQLEINDFWQRREDELAALARSLAEEALAGNSEMVTEYLNSQERRIVHVTLREDSRVKTYALGTGMIKRVAVAPADFPERTGEEDAG